jgi:hypothetical protein
MQWEQRIRRIQRACTYTHIYRKSISTGVVFICNITVNAPAVVRFLMCFCKYDVYYLTWKGVVRSSERSPPCKVWYCLCIHSSYLIWFNTCVCFTP